MGQNQSFPPAPARIRTVRGISIKSRISGVTCARGPRVRQKVIWEPEIFPGPREINKLGLLGYGPVYSLRSNVQWIRKRRKTAQRRQVLRRVQSAESHPRAVRRTLRA